ncbi:MANSC domain-containing protein 1 isoform X2 [Nerophis ophidion]|uniref:MANSC domain-containing protein 1 isoform X2 n=1 Tax=Nerophis ophidion TaxID=159077 RepID=UPI002AE09052|nr:MANSC domain-containing protein 1 isoform X2 [Nerophis ophidion]
MTLTLHAPLVRTLGLFVVVVVVLRAEPDTCFSRQHQNAIVNVRLAFNVTGSAMDTRVVHSEQDCVLACCSQQVKPGAKCNMAVFNGNKTGGEDNCFLFHCPTEQACPLMAQSGVRTYDIYKGMIHPATIRPVSMTTSTTTAPPPPTTTTTHSSTTPPTPKATATPIFPSAAPTTTLAVKATPTKRPNKTSKKQNKTTRKGKGHAVTVHSTTTSEEVLATTLTPPTTSAALPTTVSATSLAPPSTTMAATTPPSTTMAATTPPSTTMAGPTSTTTTLIMAPPMTRSTTTVAPPTTTSTTSPPITMALTTKAPSTPPPPLPGRTVASSTMSAYAGRTSQNVVIVPHIDVQAPPTLRNTGNTRGKAPTAAQGALRIGVVAFMVVAIAVVSLALAVGGRKAMESFDRRHYTRLELNDLHYDV